MNFDCPACHTPHSFPAEEIPSSGITVACTQCGMHIDLTAEGAVSGPDLGAPATSQAPQAPSGGFAEDIAATGHMPEMSPLAGDASDDDGTRTEAQLPVEPLPPAPQASQPPAPEPPAPEPLAPEPPAPEPAEAPAKGGGPMSRFKKKKSDPKPDEAKAPSKPAEKPQHSFLDPDDEMEPERAPAGLNIPGFAADSDQWTWRDLPAAFMGVADAKRVLYAAAAFSIVFVAYFLLTWVGALLGSLLSILGTIFNVVAGVAAFGLFTFIGAVMAYVCFQTVIEGRSSSIKAGVTWAKGHIKSVVGTPLAFLAVILAVGLAEGVVGLLGRIPFAGPIIWGLVSPATVVLSLAAGLVAVAAFYSLPLYVPVIYCEQTGPVETLKRLLALFKAHGFKLVGYVLLAAITIGLIFGLTVMPALSIANKLTAGVGGAAMGADLGLLPLSAPGGFGLPAALATGGTITMGGDPGFGHTLGGIFAGVGGCLLLGLLTAVLMLAYYTSGGIIYSIVTGRKKS